MRSGSRRTPIPGLLREVNEDRFHFDLARGLFMVVDGVGGQAAGGKAADTAISLLRARLERETGPVAERLREAITVANNEIHRLAGLRPEWAGMACVLTVAVVVDEGRATDRARRRYPALPAAPRPHRKGDPRPLAGRRARGCGRDLRAGGDEPPAAERGVSRRRFGAAPARRSRVHRGAGRAVRARRGAAAVQRRADRRRRLVVDSARRRAVGRASAAGRRCADRGGERCRRQRQRHGGLRRGGAVRRRQRRARPARSGDHPPARAGRARSPRTAPASTAGDARSRGRRARGAGGASSDRSWSRC